MYNLTDNISKSNSQQDLQVDDPTASIKLEINKQRKIFHFSDGEIKELIIDEVKNNDKSEVDSKEVLI